MSAPKRINDGRPDALTEAILRQRPELAGEVHYVNGRAWCDGVNHTTMCEPAGRAMSDQAADAHEVSACYDNLRLTPEGYASPVLDCSCGFTSTGDDWEEAGGEFDHHLASVREAAP